MVEKYSYEQGEVMLEGSQEPITESTECELYFPTKIYQNTSNNMLCKISQNKVQNISLNKMVLTILKRLLVSEATIRCNRHPQCFKGLQQFLLMVILPFLSI